MLRRPVAVWHERPLGALTSLDRRELRESAIRLSEAFALAFAA